MTDIPNFNPPAITASSGPKRRRATTPPLVSHILPLPPLKRAKLESIEPGCITDVTMDRSMNLESAPAHLQVLPAISGTSSSSLELLLLEAKKISLRQEISALERERNQLLTYVEGLRSVSADMSTHMDGVIEQFQAVNYDLKRGMLL